MKKWIALFVVVTAMFLSLTALLTWATMAASKTDEVRLANYVQDSGITLDQARSVNQIALGGKHVEEGKAIARTSFIEVWKSVFDMLICLGVIAVIGLVLFGIATAAKDG